MNAKTIAIKFYYYLVHTVTVFLPYFLKDSKMKFLFLLFKLIRHWQCHSWFIIHICHHRLFDLTHQTFPQYWLAVNDSFLEREKPVDKIRTTSKSRKWFDIDTVYSTNWSHWPVWCNYWRCQIIGPYIIHWKKVSLSFIKTIGLKRRSSWRANLSCSRLKQKQLNRYNLPNPNKKKTLTSVLHFP